MTDNLTTLLCLFHHESAARAATRDLEHLGIAQTAISVIDSTGSTPDQRLSILQELGVPERDQRHLLDGIGHGGIIVVVEAISSHVAGVERIFGQHQASKIDEAAIDTGMQEAAPLPVPVAPIATTAAAEAAIPVVEEQLVVGKREVGRGGVRVYRHVVEVPVEDTVSLREEHVTLERHAVDRPATEQDLSFAGDRTIELTETAEEVVVGKTAQVVEEIHISKEASDRTEHVHDTVRRTEVEVEQVEPQTTGTVVPRQI